MTDREKLRDIRIYCNGVKHLLDCDELSKPSFGHMYDMLNAIYSIMAEPQYQPSSRPCFDKPVGVPILHGETV